MDHPGTMPDIQSIHTDHTDWTSLAATGIEAFYAELASEAYQPIQTLYKRHINVGDFRLTREIGHSSSYDYLCVYEQIPLTNTSPKKIFFSLKGSNSLWDYITDAAIMHDYSTAGVSTVFDNLYEYLFNVNYNAVKSYMEADPTPTLHQYCLVGHSLGGMLAYDIYTKLLDNNEGGNFTCRLFNPYTLLTSRYVSSLQKVKNAVDGVTGFSRYLGLKMNVHQYICRGDLFAQTAIWHGPGQVSTYPAKEEIADVNDLSISSITWNASKEMANHKLSNFYELQPHSTQLQLVGTTFYDGETGQIPLDGETVVIYNKTTRDLTTITDVVGQYHVKIRAQVGDWSNVKGNAFYENATDQDEYNWLISQIPQAYHCYYTDNGNARWVTPIYELGNAEFSITQTVFFKHVVQEAGIDYFNIVKLGYNYAFTDSNSVLNVPAYTPDTLADNRATGVPVNNMGFTQTAGLVDPAAINRRLFNFIPIAVAPLQGEGETAWTDPDNRRMIHTSLADPMIHPSGKSIGFTYNSLDNGQGWDAYDIDFALYDTGGGFLKWGHIDVGDYNNYKVVFGYTTTANQYCVKSNSWTSGVIYTPEYEIVYYDTDRYMIKNTDILNNGKYLKRPTPGNTLLSTTTSAMMYQNSSAHFIDMEWDAWDGLTGSPDDYLFHIKPFAQPIPRQLGSSLANHDAAGNVFETYLFYPHYMKSPDEQYILTFQRDGNLALFSSAGAVIYTSGTFYAGNGVVLQIDGNVVIYDDNIRNNNTTNQARWSSGTGGGKIIFSVTNTGKIVITDDQDNDLWTT